MATSAKPSTKICKDDPKKGCDVINAWAKEMEVWGLKVKAKLDELSDGGPTTVPPPPKAPFA